MSYIEFKKDKVKAVLSGLTKDTKPQWGEMNPQQMVEHLIFVIRASVGEIERELVTPEAYLEKSKAFLMSDKPMPVEYKAPFLKEADFEHIHENLDDAKEELLEHIDKFENYFDEKDGATHLHPVFGVLNYEEWVWLHRKHFTHHFKQFGLIE